MKAFPLNELYRGCRETEIPPPSTAYFRGIDLGVKRICNACTAYVEKRSDQGSISEAKGKGRPTEERFLLRVDGQVKRSFSSKGPALTAGGAIEKAYPVVVVSLVDTEDGTTEFFNA